VTHRKVGGVLAAYLLLAVVATWPLARRSTDHVVGDEASQGMCVGTPNLNVWAMGFVLHQLPRDPLHLFEANAFYPYPRSLAFSEHLFVPALIAAPFLALTGNLVLAYNIASLLTLALAGLGMYLLARELVGDGVPAFAAGLLYAFHSFNVNELLRIQILSNQWFPFLVLAFLRFFRAPGAGRAAAVGLFYVLQSLSCMYWLLYAPFVVAPVALVLWWRTRPAWRSLLPLAVSLGGALALCAVFVWPYLENARAFGFERTGIRSMPLDRYAFVLPGNWLYSTLLPSTGPNEHAAHFVGFVSLALAAFGLMRLRQSNPELRRLAPALLFLVAFGVAASLGPRLEFGSLSIPGPYAFLRAYVPGFEGSRYPERFSILALIGLAPFVASGLHGLRRVRGLALLLAALVFLEHQSTPLGLAYLPGRDRIPEVYRWLARQEDVHVVAEVPTSRYYGERSDGIPMYLSTFHWKRTVQGYTGYFPPVYQFLKWVLYSFPSTGDTSLLAQAGIDSLVVAPGAVPGRLLASTGVEMVGPFPGGHVVLRLRPNAPATTGDLRPFHPVARGRWRVTASGTDPGKALDGDVFTAWSDESPRSLPYYRVDFRDSVRVSRIRLGLRTGQWAFPTHFDVRGIVAGRRTVDLPLDKRAAYSGLLRSLLESPLNAVLFIEIPPTQLRGVLIRQARKDPFRMPWSIAEFDVEAAPGGSAPAQAEETEQEAREDGL
jgi:hypothetical protein